MVFSNGALLRIFWNRALNGEAINLDPIIPIAVTSAKKTTRLKIEFFMGRISAILFSVYMTTNMVALIGTMYKSPCKK
jgi:hypothetical protein